ncbi:hypothetical protein V6N13_033517 [Hibiscus sabdariffa]
MILLLILQLKFDGRSREGTRVKVLNKVVGVGLEALDRFQVGFPTRPSRLKWSSPLELAGIEEAEPTALDAIVVVTTDFET